MNEMMGNDQVSIMLFEVNTLENDPLGLPVKCPADSFLIRLREQGKEMRILLDGAKKGQGKEVIIPYLVRHGIFDLDCVIISHAHNDHFGGIIDLLNDPRFTIHHFVYAPIEDSIVKQSDSEENYLFWRELRQHIDKLPKVTELDERDEGTSLSFGEKLSLDIVSTPDREVLKTNQNVDLNNFNLVLRLRYGSFTALFPGDCGEDQAAQILRSPQSDWIRSVTMLKAAHHGGDASTTPEFIEACQAKIVVIPCNETVVEHRPSFIQNLHRFTRFGAKVLRADWARELEVRTDGKAVICSLRTDGFTETTRMEL